MQVRSIASIKSILRRYRITVREGLLLLAFMGVAALIAYEYDIFPNPPGVPTQDYTIEPDEAFALATLLCVGLLVLSWRFLLVQWREVAQRIAARPRTRDAGRVDSPSPRKVSSSRHRR